MLNNQFIEVGRLVADAEAGTTKSGKPMSYFRVAVDNYYNGENHPDFIPVHAFGKNADLLNNYGEKGRMVILELSHRNRKYVDKNGNTRWASDFTVVHSMFITSSSNRVKKEDVDHPQYHQTDLFSEEDYDNLMNSSDKDPFADENEYYKNMDDAQSSNDQAKNNIPSKDDHKQEEKHEEPSDDTKLDDLSDTDKAALGML